MQVTILTSVGDVKRTGGGEFLVTIDRTGMPSRRTNSLERKRFAARPGWGIIRAHRNKRAFEPECSTRIVCSKTFAKIARRILGGNGERPSMEFHCTSGRVSALCGG